MTAEPLANPAPRGGRGPLWAMTLIFGLPFVAAMLFYLNPGWLPDSRGNRGALIDPPVATGAWRLHGIDGELLPSSQHAGTWVLMMAADPDCGAPCRQRLYDLRQVRLATGVARARVERQLLFSTAPAEDVVAMLREGDPRLDLAVVAERAVSIGHSLEPGAVVLVDPMGDAILYYAPTAPATDLLKDLKYLLKVSKDWSAPRQ